MPEWLLPVTFVALLEELRPVFSAPSFENFRVVIVGWVHALGRRRISDVLRGAGRLADKHYASYYRFFSHARWCLDELGLRLLSLVVKLLPAEAVVELPLDDTLSRHRGKKIALGSVHADPVLRQGGKPFYAYGHVFVVLSVYLRVPWLPGNGWALPFMFRLYEGSRHGGREDAPSDKKRRAARRRRGLATRRRRRMTDRTVRRGELVACRPRPCRGPVPDGIRPTKLELAAEMVLGVAQRFPHIRFRVLGDHLYCGRALLHTVHSRVQNVGFVVRGHPDAALYELPPERSTPRRGRPRSKGARLPCPQRWASDHAEDFDRTEVDLYGETVPLDVGSYLGMAYRTLPGRQVRYVVAHDPRGIYRPTYVMSTDHELSAAEVVGSYSHRWPLERTFQEAKQKLGMQDPQTQLPASVRRAAPTALLVYSLVVLWYLRDGHRQLRRMRVLRDPWHDKRGRPSFSDMLAALRRLGWRRAFSDPASLSPARSKTLAAYLCRVVAVA
jgi:hypothetical protein